MVDNRMVLITLSRILPAAVSNLSEYLILVQHCILMHERSASGSAIAASLGLAVGALATETSGSILLPAEKSNVVGIKPTLGLTSRDMVIPISLRQDTVGIHARTVKDAAYLLSAISGIDQKDNSTLAQPFPQIPNYSHACKTSALMDARLGVPRNGIAAFLDSHSGPTMDAFEEALRFMKGAGGRLIDNANFRSFDLDAIHRHRNMILTSDFAADLQGYLSELETNPNQIHDLSDLVQFTKKHPLEQWPNRDVR